MRVIFTAFQCLLAATCSGWACSPPDATDPFRPETMEWQQHPGPGQQGGTGEYWEPIPAPVVEVLEVDRGFGSDGTSCDDMGILSLTLKLPVGSTYSIGEFAAYFRVKRGMDSGSIFPNLPLTGLARGDVSYYQFFWLDGAPEKQEPIDLELEVFLVAKDLSIGPSTIVEIKSP